MNAANDHYPNALLLSAVMHGVALAVIVFSTIAWGPRVKESSKIIELVAGAGNNYGATVAPALGVPGGVNLPLTAPPAPKAEPKPAAPAPTPATIPAKAAEQKAPNFVGPIRRGLVRAEVRAKAAVAKERADEQKRLTKKEYDDAARAAKAGATATPPKIAKIDGEGIAKGVAGGSTLNKEGGAGGKALTRDEGDLFDAYTSLLRQRLQEAFVRPAGLSDTLVATVQFYLGASGTLSQVRIAKTSGSAEFDRAVLGAFARMRPIGAPPDGKGEQLELEFKMREVDGG